MPAPPLRADTTEITVIGRPAPQGSKRHLGRGVMVESSKAVKPWREAVKSAVADLGEPALLDGPLEVVVTFTVPKPAGAPKTRQTWPAKRPDLDKLLRSTFDALGEAGVWRDDAQVIAVAAGKAYPGEHADALAVPGARIIVRPVRARSRTGASPSALRDAARARVGTKHRLPLDRPSSVGRGISAGQAPVVVSAGPNVTPAVNAGAA